MRIGEVSKALGGGETVAYSQKDMSDAIKTLIQQYRMVVPVAGCITTPLSTQTDPAALNRLSHQHDGGGPGSVIKG